MEESARASAGMAALTAMNAAVEMVEAVMEMVLDMANAARGEEVAWDDVVTEVVKMRADVEITAKAVDEALTCSGSRRASAARGDRSRRAAAKESVKVRNEAIEASQVVVAAVEGAAKEWAAPTPKMKKVGEVVLATAKAASALLAVVREMTRSSCYKTERPTGDDVARKG